MDLNRRMDVHDVARTDQARMIEVPRLEEQRIQGSEVPSAARFCVAARHVRLQAQAGTPRYTFHRVALRRSHRPCENVPRPECSDLEYRLDVIIEACVPAEESDTERLPPLCARARGVAGMVISESQIVQIGAEDDLRNERRRRCVDAPEELAGRLVVELRFPFPRRPCNERVYLRTASRRDELSAVELERNVWRLPRRDQSARAIRHLEPSATKHDVSRP